MRHMMHAGRGAAGLGRGPRLGQILLGVGLLAVAVRVLKGSRGHRAARRAAWRAAFERYANQPLPIDQPIGGAYDGAGYGGPIHWVALS